MCNTVSNAVSSAFVTQPQRNGTPDPTRPDPLVTEVGGSWANQVQIATAVTREAAAIGFGAIR